MPDLNINISLIHFNVNELNAPNKNNCLTRLKEQYSTTYALEELGLLK